MYPEPVWEEKAEQILKLKVAGNESLQRYQNLLLHNAEILEWDSAGRVLIPANLRKRVDFEKEVTLVGRAKPYGVVGSRTLGRGNESGFGYRS